MLPDTDTQNSACPEQKGILEGQHTNPTSYRQSAGHHIKYSAANHTHSFLNRLSKFDKFPVDARYSDRPSWALVLNKMFLKTSKDVLGVAASMYM